VNTSTDEGSEAFCIFSTGKKKTHTRFWGAGRGRLHKGAAGKRGRIGNWTCGGKKKGKEEGEEKPRKKK